MRYMAHEAMSGKYPRTRAALIGATPENIVLNTYGVTAEFENPRVVNPRGGFVANGYRAGPKSVVENPPSENGPFPEPTAPGGVRIKPPGGLTAKPGTYVGQDSRGNQFLVDQATGRAIDPKSGGLVPQARPAPTAPLSLLAPGHNWDAINALLPTVSSSISQDNRQFTVSTPTTISIVAPDPATAASMVGDHIDRAASGT